MSKKCLIEDIFSESPYSRAVFEDFMDDVSIDDIGEEITVSEDETTVEDYPHFIEWEMVSA